MIKKISGKNNSIPPSPETPYKKKTKRKQQTKKTVNLLVVTFSQNSLSRICNQKFQSNKLKEEK